RAPHGRVDRAKRGGYRVGHDRHHHAGDLLRSGTDREHPAHAARGSGPEPCRARAADYRGGGLLTLSATDPGRLLFPGDQAAAVAGGKVQVNGSRAKPAKQVQVGDNLRVRLGPYDWIITVSAVPERRGSARDAPLLYDESPGGRAARARLAEAHKIAPAPTY